MTVRVLFLAAFVATGASAGPLKLVVPDFNAVGPSKEKATFYTEHISGRLAEVGADVVTQRALAQLIGIERQKQLLGCASDSSSCLAELASALGTDALLLGDIAQIDTLIQVNLKIVSGSGGQTVSTYQARVNSESALLDELDKAAYSLVAEAAAALGRDTPRALKSKGPSLRLLSVVPVGVGIICAALSGVFFVQAGSAYAKIPRVDGDMPRPVSEVEAIAASGKTMQLLAWVFAGVGIAALGTGAAMFALGGKKPTVQATVAPAVGGGGGASFNLWGEW